MASREATSLNQINLPNTNAFTLSCICAHQPWHQGKILFPLAPLFRTSAPEKCLVKQASGASIFSSIMPRRGAHHYTRHTTPAKPHPHSRFGSSSLHQRDPRSALFENYNGGGATASRAASSSPNQGYGGGYGYTGTSVNGSANNLGIGYGERSYRPATPNSRYVVLGLPRGGEKKEGVG